MSSLRAYRQAKRVIGVLRGRDLLQRTQIRCKRLDLGDKGANWCVCPDALSSSSIVYSLGVGEDISFDRELIQSFGLTVNAFDPTPRSIEWLAHQQLPTGFVFHSYGVADFDGNARLSPPSDPIHVSHTLLRRESSSPAVEVEVHRLSTLMSMLGHKQIDLLKMDIEGAEYGVIADLISCAIPVRQLLVEFHHRWAEIGKKSTKEAINALNAAGFRIFDISPNGEEYSFLFDHDNLSEAGIS